MAPIGSRSAARSVTHRSDPSGFVNGAVSGTNVAFNLNAETAAFSGSAFTFKSAYFTGAWNDGLNIHVEGYLASTLVHSIDFTVDATGLTLEIFNWVVDDMHSSSWAATNHGYGVAGELFAVNDVRINEAVNAVPEPSAIILLATIICIFRFTTLVSRKVM